MTEKEVFIPFCGFYESWIDGIIESCIENELIENDHTDYTVDFEAIARDYVDLYNQELEDQLKDEDAERFMPDLKFKKLIQPREYNFETDRILCTFTCPRYNLRQVYNTLVGNSEALNKDIQEMFASREGFASFYDDFAKNWREKPLLEWDVNELSILLPDVVEPYIDEPWFHESVDGAVNFNVPA